MSTETPGSATPPPVPLRPHYTVSSPADLVALAPVVLGFHPAESVVMMTFGSPDGAFHARADLPSGGEELEAVTAMLLDAARRNRVGSAAVLVYTDDDEVAGRQGAALAQGLDDLGLGVVAVLRVGEQEWFEVPERGRGGTPYDVRDHRFTAQRVFAGHVVHADRAALVATLAASDDERDRDQVRAHAAETAAVLLGAEPALRQREARWLQQVVRAHVVGVVPPAREAGRLLAHADLTSLRDVALVEITRADADRHLDLWRGLVRRAPDALVPGAAALLAFAAWQHGDGALAWCAVDRCHAVDPQHSLARCVAGALQQAVPPGVWRPVGEEDLEVFHPPRRRADRSRRSGRPRAG